MGSAMPFGIHHAFTIRQARHDPSSPSGPAKPKQRPGTTRQSRKPASSYCTCFSTWPNSNSTGVGRPKINTATLSRARSSSTSST